jgi:hypothetical protein
MAELPKMVWDPVIEKFVPLDTDGTRVMADRRRIMLGIAEARKARDSAKADWLEAVETIQYLVAEGLRYHIPMTDMSKAAGASRQAIYKQIPSLEEEEAALSEGAS